MALHKIVSAAPRVRGGWLLGVKLMVVAALALGVCGPLLAQQGVPSYTAKVAVKPPELYEDLSDPLTYIFNDGAAAGPDQLSRWSQALSKTDRFSLTSATLAQLSAPEMVQLANGLNGLDFEIIFRGLGSAGACEEAAEGCRRDFDNSNGGPVCETGLFSDPCGQCGPYYDNLGEDLAPLLISRIDAYQVATGDNVDRVRTEGLFKQVFPRWHDDQWGCDLTPQKAIREGIDFIQALLAAHPHLKFTDGINGTNWMTVDPLDGTVYPCGKGFPDGQVFPGHSSRCHGGDMDGIAFRQQFYTALEAVGVPVGRGGILDGIHSDGEYRLISENAAKPCLPADFCEEEFNHQEYAKNTAEAHPQGVNGWFQKMAAYIALADAWDMDFEKTFNTKNDDTYIPELCAPGETVEECQIRVTFDRVLAFVKEWGDRMSKLGVRPYPDFSQFNQFGAALTPMPLFPEHTGATFFHMVNEGEALLVP